MCKFSSFFLLVVLIASLPVLTHGQACSITVSGRVYDGGTEQPLEYADVYVEEAEIGAQTDDIGNYVLPDLCPGGYHLRFTHIGCEPERRFISITSDTTLNMRLNHHVELIDEVVVHGKREDNSAQAGTTLAREEIVRKSDQNLADLLSGVAGVSVLRNGAGIAKPVIHGLYGNRITILNNGIAQSGQQWGNDHAPEIDPFAADHLSVIKGTSALAYSGNALGGVVLVEPGGIPDEPHLHGRLKYGFQANGRGHTLNALAEKAGNWAAWRVLGTVKASGDVRAPDYLLTNTGKREANAALQLAKNWTKKDQTQLYYSLFTADIGILRGANLGNLTDLEQALEREEPFLTAPEFSYDINSPRQQVRHHLLKATHLHQLSDERSLKATYSLQVNDRREFDVRRGGRSNVPALSLTQYTHFGEGVYTQTLPGGGLLKAGLQGSYVDNTNNPGTGILPLIPNYDGLNGSAFVIAQRDRNRWFYELGARYDLRILAVTAISRDLPLRIQYFDHVFNNYSFGAGLKYKVSDPVQLRLNAGYVLRSPEINELYSFGLHQGVSGLEEGDPDLSAERSLKLLAGLDLKAGKSFFLQAVGYYQRIADYIYLQPQRELRLTIRGAFPVFIYQQTDASLLGADLLATYDPTDHLRVVVKYATVRGRDEQNGGPLVFIPPADLSMAVTYGGRDYGRFERTSVTLRGQYTFAAPAELSEQDFLPPPPGYFLLDAQFSTTLRVGKRRLEIGFSAENLLNIKYRNYLNRLRYFADEPGIGVGARVGWEF